jgi:hypothetical protein
MVSPPIEVITRRNVKHAINLLNEAFKMDPEAINKLVGSRVKCNKELADHPTIQVLGEGDPMTFTVGLLGILNGIFGKDGNGTGYIGIELDEEEWQIEKFVYLNKNAVPVEDYDDSLTPDYVGGPRKHGPEKK